MSHPSSHTRVFAALLLLAAARTWLRAFDPPPPDLLDEAVGPPTVLPDLRHDGWVRLSWLPGIGLHRARLIVSERAHLGAPLTPHRLQLLPGIGERTASEVADWYGRQGRRAAPPAPRPRPITATGALR